MFGHYNAWANKRLYDAATRLTDEQYRADRGAFFKSAHGTLNHLLVTDRIWMQRFTGEGHAPNQLDAILFETFDRLCAARETEDRRIVDYVDGLDDTRIAGTIKYRRVSSPEQFEQQLASALALVQPPDPSPRPCPRVADGPGRRSAGTRPVVFSAAVGQIRRLRSRKLHFRCASCGQEFAGLSQMQQNCALRCRQFLPIC
jgi:uncharacterized damage-inducible protein DinB